MTKRLIRRVPRPWPITPEAGIRVRLVARRRYHRVVRSPTDRPEAMTTGETLPELIHRLVGKHGRAWVEREIEYDADTIDRHLLDAVLVHARRHPRGPATDPGEVTTDPLPLADLAALLRVRNDTLSRALRNDPAAPSSATAPGTRAAWRYADIHAWWPNRRRRGQYDRPAGGTA
ncbi:hypothetical protein [Streptomyces yaizuensis]|uniref:Helix-turn-helix domain-containing protein n=1 Tax=Streptomyces yaizuensis TaxID=2989713 RepID=A0ABQ5P6I6_9ACTN|nr:hypothetical protein [Streptomyces sp. YSPA8]GLF98169.1 hypothetical protein SYYSPA8_27750 [Streptomyces sp. YSPA8]